MPKLLPAILMILCATVLTACGGERVVIVKPPVALTSCAGEPDAPDLAPVDWSSVETAKPVQRERDQATLAYILALRSAWGSCAAKVAGVKDWAKGLE